MSPRERDEPHEVDRARTTPEVGDEGGTPGDLEIGVTTPVGTGSEADETWRPADEERSEKGSKK